MSIIACGGNAGLLSETEIVVPARVVGVPVPNNEEAIEWWLQQAEDDIDRVLGLLSDMERLGKGWASKLIDQIAEQCNL
jgi:hypothetical protein